MIRIDFSGSKKIDEYGSRFLLHVLYLIYLLKNSAKIGSNILVFVHIFNLQTLSSNSNFTLRQLAIYAAKAFMTLQNTRNRLSSNHCRGFPFKAVKIRVRTNQLLPHPGHVVGYQKMMGHESLDLLQNRHILPPEEIEPPKPRLQEKITIFFSQDKP